MALVYVIDEYALLKKKREKLKLGKIIFEIKNTYFNEILIYEELEMIHCRQDNTRQNELKLETILKRYDWQWDFNNIAAAILVLYFSYCLIKAYLFANFFVFLVPVELTDSPAFCALLQYTFSSMSVETRFLRFAPSRLVAPLIYDLIGEIVVFFKLI